MRLFLLSLLTPESGTSSSRFIALVSLFFGFLIISIYVGVALASSAEPPRFQAEQLKPILDFIVFVLGISITGATTSKFTKGKTSTTEEDSTKTIGDN